VPHVHERGEDLNPVDRVGRKRGRAENEDFRFRPLRGGQREKKERETAEYDLSIGKNRQRQ